MKLEVFNRAQDIVREINRKEAHLKILLRIVTSAASTGDTIELKIFFGSDELYLDPACLCVTTILNSYCKEVAKEIAALKKSLEEL